MELTFELELPGGVVRPVTVLGAERPTITQIERRLAKVLQGEGVACDADAVRLRSARLQRELLGPRTLVREGIEDGERLVLHTRTSPERPAAGAAATPSRPAGLPMPALLGAVAVGAVIACAAFGVVALVNDAGAGETTAAVIAADATDSGIEPAYEEAPAEPVEETTGASDEVADEELASAEPEPIDAAFEAGEWVQLASFRSSESAWSEAERLSSAGIDATVIDSADALELFPGFHVVAAGPFVDLASRRQALRRARAAGIADAKPRVLTPVETALDLASLMGGYEGQIDFIDPARPARSQTMSASLFVDEDGSAKLSYETPDCTASLEEIEMDRAVSVWDQVTESSDCFQNGTWQIKLSGDEVLMSWERDGSTRWMAGRLARVSGD